MTESSPITVLAVGAHPDDIEFMAAGALARLHKSGCRLFFATMTAGDCGSAELGPEEIMSIRREEAAASARLLQAGYACMEERDLAIDYDSATRRKVTALLRDVRPRIVLTHPREDYMVDHEITSLLVRDACFAASIPNYSAPTESLPTERVPYLYYWDPLEGRDDRGNLVNADFTIDITPVMELKRRMLACHASQREWLRRQHGMDQYLASMEEWGRSRGEASGYPYAEGFNQHRGHPYPQDNLLLELIERG